MVTTLQKNMTMIDKIPAEMSQRAPAAMADAEPMLNEEHPIDKKAACDEMKQTAKTLYNYCK